MVRKRMVSTVMSLMMAAAVLTTVPVTNNVKAADKEITNYFLTYLFPLISGPDAFMDIRIASFFAVSLFFYISFSGSYSFNPLLSFWGYKYYEAEDDTGVSFVILSKKPLLKASGNRVNLIKLTDYTYIAI